jgi:hypothetical protein
MIGLQLMFIPILLFFIGLCLFTIISVHKIYSGFQDRHYIKSHQAINDIYGSRMAFIEAKKNVPDYEYFNRRHM